MLALQFSQPLNVFMLQCVLFYPEVPDAGEPRPRADLERYVCKSIFLHVPLGVAPRSHRHP